MRAGCPGQPTLSPETSTSRRRNPSAESSSHFVEKPCQSSPTHSACLSEPAPVGPEGDVGDLVSRRSTADVAVDVLLGVVGPGSDGMGMEQPEEVADLVGQHHTFGVEPRRLVLRLTPNGVNLTLCGLLRGFPRGCQSFAGSKMNRRSADPKMVCTRSTASAHAAAVTLHPRPPSLSVSGMARDRMEYASGISCPFFEDDLARSGLYSWELSLVLTMEPCQGGAWGSLSGTMTDTEFVPGGNDGLSGRGDGVRADITFGDWCGAGAVPWI